MDSIIPQGRKQKKGLPKRTGKRGKSGAKHGKGALGLHPGRNPRAKARVTEGIIHPMTGAYWTPTYGSKRTA